MQQPADAEASYRKAVQLDPEFAEAHLSLGLLLARADRPDEARPELKIAAAAPDSSIKAHAFRDLAHLEAATSPADASADHDEALKLSPETPADTLLAAQLAEAADNPTAAEAAYRRILASPAENPDHTITAEATTSLARLLLHQQHPAEAETVLTAALTQHPDDPVLSSQLVAAYMAQFKSAEALPLAEKIHRSYPADANLTRLLAHLYDESGQPAKANTLYAALVAQSAPATLDPTLLDDQATALIHLNRPAEAEALLKQAVAKPDSFPTRQDFGLASSHLAFAASNNNDPVTVLQALSLRAKVLPQSPSSLYLGATANDTLRLYKQAIDLYQQFLAVGGGKFPDEESEARKRLKVLQH